jgi:hypothetical protein
MGETAMSGDVYGPVGQGLWVYSQYAKGKIRDLEGITEQINQDPQNAAKLNELQIRIQAINNALSYAQDVASLLLTLSKPPQ